MISNTGSDNANMTVKLNLPYNSYLSYCGLINKRQAFNQGSPESTPVVAAVDLKMNFILCNFISCCMKAEDGIFSRDV